MFIGEFFHSIDDKNRVSVPKQWRNHISGKMVVTRGLDNSLFLYTASQWDEIAKKISDLGFGSADSRGISRFLLANAQFVEADKAGRILIPDRLLSFAKINSKVVFAGVYNRIEIWDETQWDKYQKGIETKADDIAEHLGEVGMI